MEKSKPVGRGRRWTSSERTQWVREYHASGLTQERFAAERQLNLGTLRGWIYKGTRESEAGVGTFASVQVVGGGRQQGGGAVTVRWPTGMEVEVAATLDEGGVMRLVRELVAPCLR